MNPRYINYCRINGNTPDEQHKKDTKKYPGGPMLGFINFIQNEIGIFKKDNPMSFMCGSLVDHKGFDKYLDNLKPL